MISSRLTIIYDGGKISYPGMSSDPVFIVIPSFVLVIV